MGLNIQEVPKTGGGWFKPAEHKEDVAILIEVHAFDRQRPTPNGPKDSALVDMTFFGSDDDLDALSPSSVVEGTRIEQTALAGDLAGLVGAATIVTVVQLPPKGKPFGAWVWRPVSQTVKGKVIAYADKREAEVAEALNDVPDF